MDIFEITEEEALALPDGINYIVVWEHDNSIWCDTVINSNGEQLVFNTTADDFVDWESLPYGLEVGYYINEIK